ncbi:MAG: putative glycosyltransferase [Frankiales bacterium]|nr:putative glycosyltransferase [Frankiales bacterium]
MTPLRNATVCVPVYGQAAVVLACLESLDRHTPPEVPLLVLDDASPDQETRDVLSGFVARTRRKAVLHTAPSNGGFVRSANTLFGLAAPSDVLLVNSDVVVGPGWFEELQRVASSATDVATVTAATDQGTLATVPGGPRTLSTLRERLIAGELVAQQVAPALLPVGIGHCMWVTRESLDVAGGFDEAFGRGYGEEVDFSLRASAVGFTHLLAPGVIVSHVGGASFGEDSGADKKRNDARVAERHPRYGDQLEMAWRQALNTDRETSRIRGLRHAMVSARGLRLGIDCRMVGNRSTGTGRFVSALVTALAARPGVSGITLYVPPQHLAMWDDVVTRGHDGLTWTLVPCHVDSFTDNHEVDCFVRPAQFQDALELRLALSAAPRLHLHLLDGIAYENITYFATADDWDQYRSVLESSVELADTLSVNARFVAAFLERVGLRDDAVVVYNGTDHLAVSGSTAPPPGPLDPIRLLQFGAAFPHKNRLHSIAVAAELARRGRDVVLELIGPDPDHCSTRSAEAAACERARGSFPGLEVQRRAFVSEAELESAITEAHVVLYPSITEGFGLVPFEAAHHGRPCLSSRGGSLDEVMPPEVLVSGFAAGAWADRVETLVRDPQAAAENIAALRHRAAEHTWERVAERLVEQVGSSLLSTRAAYLQPRIGTLDLQPGELDTGVREVLSALPELIVARDTLYNIHTSRRWKFINQFARVVGR